jgi:hypothetical protein
MRDRLFGAEICHKPLRVIGERKNLTLNGCLIEHKSIRRPLLVGAGKGFSKTYCYLYIYFIRVSSHRVGGMNNEGEVWVDLLLYQNRHLGLERRNSHLLPRNNGSLSKKGEPYFCNGLSEALIALELHIQHGIEETRTGHFLEVLQSGARSHSYQRLSEVLKFSLNLSYCKSKKILILMIYLC